MIVVVEEEEGAGQEGGGIIVGDGNTGRIVNHQVRGTERAMGSRYLKLSSTIKILVEVEVSDQALRVVLMGNCTLLWIMWVHQIPLIMITTPP